MFKKKNEKNLPEDNPIDKVVDVSELDDIDRIKLSVEVSRLKNAISFEQYFDSYTSTYKV